MAVTSHLLASGPGWRAGDFVCTAGPHDRPFEERHDWVCVAAVTQGTFQYRSAHGAAVLAPGAVLLGNQGRCFECGHEHATGDRCLAFQFTPDEWEGIVAAVPGARPMFVMPSLPPLRRLMRLLAAAEAARDANDGEEWEELALRLAGSVASVLAGSGGGRAARRPSRSDERRISEALRRIEASADEPHSLADLAREAAMSRCHFLRVFRQVVGMTPHQFVLHTRLHRAAVRLRGSHDSVSAIAFAAGFNDLSTFNRRFRRVMGASPTNWRAANSK
jgi:AraC family transcriptional regulator